MTQPCSLCSDCSLSSVAVSLWTDRSSELSLTHRSEKSWEDDTLLVRQVCLSVLYLAWCCISSATRHWSAPVSLTAGRLFCKGQEEHLEDELQHAGRKGCSLSDNFQTPLKNTWSKEFSWIPWILFIQAYGIESFLRHCCLVLSKKRNNTFLGHVIWHL